MSRGNYLKTKLPAVCASLFGMLFLTLFLLACGNSAASILFILTAWLVFFSATKKFPGECGKNIWTASFTWQSIWKKNISLQK